jgi:hypothetical protein
VLDQLGSRDYVPLFPTHECCDFLLAILKTTMMGEFTPKKLVTVIHHGFQLSSEGVIYR